MNGVAVALVFFKHRDGRAKIVKVNQACGGACRKTEA